MPAMLKNRGILITRAADQALHLKAAVEARGGRPYVFPVLHISFSPVSRIQADLLNARAGDILIFVSTNAVRAVFGEGRLAPGLFRDLKIAAVGAATQQALIEAGQKVEIQSPDAQQTSEGLLQHPALQSLTGRHVYIIRAQSGRDTLRAQLAQRGAELSYVQGYHRGIPEQFDVKPVHKALAEGLIDTVMLSSYDAFLNLMVMLGNAGFELLRDSLLIVPSTRVEEKIKSTFPFKLRVAENASNQAMLDAAAQ